MHSLLLSALLGLSLPASAYSVLIPAFNQYPATERLHGEMVSPRITNADEREYDTKLREGIRSGYGVVDGGTEHERRGANFGGHYVLIQWGCGSNCMKAALVDANTGKVLHLPRIPGTEEQGFGVPTGSVDLRTLQFHTNSRLLGVPYIGDSYTYYYVLEQGRYWRFIKKLPTPEKP
jgi:hypothetical protein